MYVTMSIAFCLLIAASNIAVLFNARPLGTEIPAEPSSAASELGEELPCLGLPGPTTHSQGTHEKGTEEHDNADDQQIQQALGDDTHDAEHDRDDHEE
jgi:hypothetical protein